MEKFYQTLLASIGEDPNREGLRDTPKRAASALTELTQGYKQSLDDVVNDAIYPTDLNEMVIVRDIELFSLCEHHLLPFFGVCHIGYIPNGKVLGLSKLARIVDMFAKRLQIQEQLTHEIAAAIEKIIQPSGVAVIIEAKHLCMLMRGVEKQQATMTTSVMLGELRNNPSTRLEFLTLMQHR